MTVLTTLQKMIPTATQSDVDMYIDLFADATACLANYAQSVQDLTQALAIAHMMTQNSGGQVKSEKTRTGANASYNIWTGQGLLSTTFGQQLNTLPSGQCVISLFSKPPRFIRGVTPSWD